MNRAASTEVTQLISLFFGQVGKWGAGEIRGRYIPHRRDPDAAVYFALCPEVMGFVLSEKQEVM